MRKAIIELKYFQRIFISEYFDATGKPQRQITFFSTENYIIDIDLIDF